MRREIIFIEKRIHFAALRTSPNHQQIRRIRDFRPIHCSYIVPLGKHITRTAQRVPTPTPFLTTGIGQRFSRTILNLGHAALLRRCELPPINESAGAELTRGALWLIQ